MENENSVALESVRGNENMTDLAELTEKWRTVARYSVYRTEGYAGRGTERRTILHAGLDYGQARAKAASAEDALRQEAGYRSDVMSRPLISIELEKPTETRLDYVATAAAARFTV